MRAPWQDLVRRTGRRPAPAAAGPAGAVRTAAGLVAAGHPVALDPVPGAGTPEQLAALVEEVAAAGLAASCRLVVPLGDLPDAAVAGLAERARAAGVGVDLAGPPDRVRALAPRLPGAGAVVAAASPGAEEACRALAGGRVRLVAGRTRAADLAFVRCLNVLMASGGHTGVGAGDRRLLAIAGERAAWNQRDRETWEYVMEQGVQVDEQRRLLAGGSTVRVVLRWGAGR
ncbi:hypothetical protein [Trujillonella humicola]|uniref:hypothetical protein n=1 Tax=Trujillonella humicola TaxID=3383699 RepID=UPI003905BA35